MAQELSAADKAKAAAAERSVEFVEDGMRLGLGTGSTAAFMVRALGRRIREEGLRITGVPTSYATGQLAREQGIDVITLDEAGWLDLTIDGADEFDPRLTLIKGGGGAHLQEKIVASASSRMIVIADAGKRVEELGAFPLPVEVLKFGERASEALIRRALTVLDMGDAEITPRMRGAERLVTDEGNHILDLHLGRIGNPRALSAALNQVPGVVENGLFIDLCDTVIVGHEDGNSEIVSAQQAQPAAESLFG
ncbi:ribose-5-phosphate isomerase [Poseidonocella pacifica]|uniref:Ribose-5-phosphate isomerase A n=1 Tax=Poseidonocella pacifica TaxID=871651 RepID=A0A1I0X368_9RHOB|nr:ribose-5-phosphate isomerase RpiA [Poseidonocella pacifica]SFA94806.1 ribose-5-phosphate isomerase [Poseidonocella pacifica]